MSTITVFKSVAIDKVSTDAIFNNIVVAVKTVYPDIMQEAVAINAAKAAYESELALIATDAFRAGEIAVA
jgi:hypothetical protein